MSKKKKVLVALLLLAVALVTFMWVRDQTSPAVQAEVNKLTSEGYKFSTRSDYREFWASIEPTQSGPVPSHWVVRNYTGENGLTRFEDVLNSPIRKIGIIYYDRISMWILTELEAPSLNTIVIHRWLP